MSASPTNYPRPAAFLAQATAFGLLVVAGIAGIVIAGAWWASCLAAVGLLTAVAGLVISGLGLLGEQSASSGHTSRLAALALGALSIAALVAALIFA